MSLCPPGFSLAKRTPLEADTETHRVAVIHLNLDGGGCCIVYTNIYVSDDNTIPQL